MKRVTGIGGVFFMAEHPVQLYQWYEKHLGIVREPHGGGATFHWREDGGGEGRPPGLCFRKTRSTSHPARRRS